MELRISELAKQYPASGIRKMFDLAAGYDDVIALTLGEPNFETPAYIKEAAKKALDENYTHYAPNAGLPVLRQAVADRYQSYWDGYKADDVVVTVGALEGLTLCLLALLNRDDEILVPDPCFANYYGQAMIAGAKAVPVPAHEGNGFNMTAADVEKCITPKTKAIILNSPCNPTGAAYDLDTLRMIVRLAEEYDLLILADEIYTRYLYDGEFIPMRTLPGMAARTVTLNSFSKNFMMTGWRVGFIIAPREIVDAIGYANGAMIYTAPSVSQRAAIRALSLREEIRETYITRYKNRVFYATERINTIPYMTLVPPMGTFYLFPGIKKTGLSSAEFAKTALEKAHVLVGPGGVFGKTGEGHVRIACTAKTEQLKEAFDRLSALKFGV